MQKFDLVDAQLACTLPAASGPRELLKRVEGLRTRRVMARGVGRPGEANADLHPSMDDTAPCAQQTVAENRAARLSERSLLATPATGQDAGVLSARRTMKKDGDDYESDDIDESAAQDQLLPEDRRALSGYLLPPPVALQMQVGCDEQQGTSKGKEAKSAAFTSALTSAVEDGTFDFETAMEELFDSLLRVNFDDSSPAVKRKVAAEVMMQANLFMAKFLAKDERHLGKHGIATEALQAILLSLRVLLCRVDAQKQSEKPKADEDNQREELMQNVLKLFESCLHRWSMAINDDAWSDGAPRRGKQAAAVLPEAVSLAASASLRALIRGARDASNEKHCVSIIRLSVQAILCDQLPAVQMDGIALLKKMHAKYRETILEEVRTSFELPPSVCLFELECRLFMKMKCRLLQPTIQTLECRLPCEIIILILLVCVRVCAGICACVCIYAFVFVYVFVYVCVDKWQIFFLLDDERVGRRARKPKGLKVPGTGEILIQPVNAALLVVLQSIPAASTCSSGQALTDVNNAIQYFIRL